MLPLKWHWTHVIRRAVVNEMAPVYGRTVFRRINAPGAETENEPLTLSTFDKTYWVNSLLFQH